MAESLTDILNEYAVYIIDRVLTECFTDGDFYREADDIENMVNQLRAEYVNP